MVGREAELESLRAVFAMGQDGMPRAALISGEAGVGKSRCGDEVGAAGGAVSRGSFAGQHGHQPADDRDNGSHDVTGKSGEERR